MKPNLTPTNLQREKNTPTETDWSSQMAEELKDILWRKYWFRNSTVTPANIGVELTKVMKWFNKWSKKL